MNKQEKNEIVDTAMQWMGKTPLEERLDIEHYVEAVLRAREEHKSDVQRAEEYLEARLKGGADMNTHCPDCNGELNAHALACKECGTRYCNRCYSWHDCEPATTERQEPQEGEK